MWNSIVYNLHSWFSKWKFVAAPTEVWVFWLASLEKTIVQKRTKKVGLAGLFSKSKFGPFAGSRNVSKSWASAQLGPYFNFKYRGPSLDPLSKPGQTFLKSLVYQYPSWTHLAKNPRIKLTLYLSNYNLPQVLLMIWLLRAIDLVELWTLRQQERVSW